MATWILLLTALLQAPSDTAALAGPRDKRDRPLRITSPLGRTGFSGKIRIVAQVRSDDRRPLGPVRFYVDQQLLQTDTDGPPYVVEWTDENPFERREIAVEATDALGRDARDRVILEPYDVVEEAQVTSVLLEAAVQDANGRFVKGIDPARFSVREDGVPQTLDVVKHEAVGATFTLLVDSSAEHVAPPRVRPADRCHARTAT